MVVGILGRIVEERHKPLIDLEHGKLPGGPSSRSYKACLKGAGEVRRALKAARELDRSGSPHGGNG